MRTSAEESERNLTAFQHCKNIYFRVCRKLGAGEKLRVWYSEDYIHRLHAISWESIDQNLEAGELGLPIQINCRQFPHLHLCSYVLSCFWFLTKVNKLNSRFKEVGVAAQF